MGLMKPMMANFDDHSHHRNSKFPIPSGRLANIGVGFGFGKHLLDMKLGYMPMRVN